jgi:folate-binding protein YgfZ
MSALVVSRLDSRSTLLVAGESWREFLQGLITQDVEGLGPGRLRFGALLTPQGRLLYDLFLHGQADGCVIDCAAEHRDALLSRLTMYRLRAKVTLTPLDEDVFAAWGDEAAPLDRPRDPRLAALGWRWTGGGPPAGATLASEADYERHRLSQGAPGPADWGSDETYPIEADFDLLNGIDFRKGCFVGQETTSRMKRRGVIRNRMIPIVVEGPRPAPGAELLAGDLRAGEALSGAGDLTMALLRLDRLGAGDLIYGEGHGWRPQWPAWLEPETAPPDRH